MRREALNSLYRAHWRRCLLRPQQWTAEEDVPPLDLSGGKPVRGGDADDQASSETLSAGCTAEGWADAAATAAAAETSAAGEGPGAFVVAGVDALEDVGAAEFEDVEAAVLDGEGATALEEVEALADAEASAAICATRVGGGAGDEMPSPSLLASSSAVAWELDREAGGMFGDAACSATKGVAWGAAKEEPCEPTECRESAAWVPTAVSLDGAVWNAKRQPARKAARTRIPRRSSIRDKVVSVHFLPQCVLGVFVFAWWVGFINRV